MSVIIVDAELGSAPEAARVFDRLTRAGHEVVVRPGGSAESHDEPPAVAPPDEPPRAWHLVASPEACIGRPARVTTILVGPRRPATRGPARRCDLEARDLAAAALEILAREAMPDDRSRATCRSP